MAGRRRIEISNEFTESILAGLAYWQEATREIDDQAITALDRERQNLYRAVQHGLALPQAWDITAEIVLSAIPLIIRQLYRQEWIPVMEQLVRHSPTGRQETNFDLLIQLGRLQRLQQNRGSAMKTLQEAEAVAGQLEDGQALARAYYNIGRLHLDARHYPAAEEASQGALEILDTLDGVDQSLVAWILNTLAKVAQVKGEFDLAYEYYSRSTAIWRALSDQTGVARALIDLATNFRYSGQPDKAIMHYQEAERLLSPTANELDKTKVGINLGSTYADIKEYALAEETFRKAYTPYLRQSGDLEHQAILTMNLGNVLLYSGRLAEAEAFERQAIELWGQLDDDLNTAAATGSLGEILAAKEQDAAAISHFDQANALLKKYPSHPRALRLIKFNETEKQKALDRLNSRRPGQ